MKIVKSFVTGFLFVLMLFSLSNVFASTLVTGLYSADIEVSNTSAKDRMESLPQALKQVLIKITGNPDITTNPKIHAKLANASSFVQSYSYSDKTSFDNIKTTYINVLFNSKAIDEMLNNAEAASLSEQRPLVLVWVAVSDENKKWQILDATMQTPLATAIYDQAKNFGMPIILPTLNSNDLIKITPIDICNFKISSLVLDSPSYNADVILVGCIERNKADKNTTNFSYQSNWQLVINSDKSDLHYTTTSMNDTLKSLFSDSFANISKHFTQIQKKTDEELVTFHVINVNNLSDHTKVMNYLRSLSGVAQVDLADIDANSISINAVVTIDLTTLQKEVAENNTLILIPNQQPLKNKTSNTEPTASSQEPPEGNGTILNYKWQESNLPTPAANPK
jgi:uncharacterized protein